MPKFCRQYVHYLKFTSRHFMYCLSVSKEHKEIFQISFYLYCVTSLVSEEIQYVVERFCGHTTENASRLGYKQVCVNDLHVASHDYQDVIQYTDTHTHPHTHSLRESFYFFSLNFHLSFNTNSSGEWKFQILLNQKRKTQACHKQTKDRVWKHKGSKSQYS